ncbi:beta-lactamase family protein (plasmid) [Polymorphobacter sp. PAMC 29334]|uniref:serine hydrolase domain-containing protein n=1 Tax=Polymorphobacter sp. PAMC 29334 TaxID=2862331 RepID=UPI001C668DCC|nr:serine hydrolase domain-containing protein [Polymorphobacter sp. PAMC 29334]QYE33049.1 beta-lactamase family protein [Polymorphobacter sp. PAMC 29334]
MTGSAIDEDLGAAGRLQGRCAPGFEAVLDAFRANFTERREVGATVCVMRHGETLVDLWGGIADLKTGKAWEQDTVSIVFSCTKGATALCAHMIADAGKFAYHDKVTTLWPAFGQGGKSETTIEMMLSHTSPVPHLRDPIRPGGLADWDYMVERVAAEDAHWEPGTRQGYHGLTFAWTVGNIVRLAAGEPMAEYFRRNVAEPLGLDFHIGLPEHHDHRVASLVAADPAEVNFKSKFFQSVQQSPGSLPQLFLTNNGGADFNSRTIRGAEIGSANGITNARGLAGMYAPLANGGGGLVTPATVERMRRVTAATLDDAVLRQPARFGLGYMASMDNREGGGDSVILGETAFGHVGMGGSIGFADPIRGLSFGYTMNRMGGGILLNERGQSLVDAIYSLT